MAEMVLQRIVTPPRRGLMPLYCRCDGQLRKRGRRGIVLPRGAVLRTDTWFNAFFERYWRAYTHISELALRLHVSGAGILRLYRRSSEQKPILLHEIGFSGDRELYVELADAPPAPDPFGLLFFEMEARSSRLQMYQAEWTTRQVVTRHIQLVAGICTFNRASMLIRNVATLLADPDVAEVLDRIIVVDQGREKVRDHPSFGALLRADGGRLQLVEQENRGGAGGFTRCLVEAQNLDSATHVLLMDDDILLEPESVLRTAAFLSLARGDVAIGGHMLDRCRPRQLVESGSRYLPERVRIDEPSRCRIDRASDLTAFLEPRPRHYNGWWFLAFSLSVLDRAGLPLPLFLRGDDLEFGCRLMRRGVPTVTLPGVAVWHEPFERKGRGWHAFYEMRNLLIVGALHFPIIRAVTVARQFFSRLLDELLAYDYYESWLLCEAVAAYLRGPEDLRQNPPILQRHLEEQRTGSVSCRVDAPSTATHPAADAAGSPSRLRRWRLVLRNLLSPSPASEEPPRKVLHGSGEQWYDIGCADVVSVVEPHRKDAIVLRRSRGRFVRLLLRGCWLALRLLGGHRRAVRRWRASAPMLTNRTFWMDYLRQDAAPLPNGRGSACELRV